MSNKLFENTKKNKYFLPYSIIFLSISLILSYVEVLFPLNIGILGIKIGFSNIVTLISIQILDTNWTFFINILRLIIIGVLFGNLVRFIISLSGFLLSFTIMVILLKKFRFRIIPTSTFGGATHNIGQIIALALIMKSYNILSLIPIYTLFGAFTGIFIGILTKFLYKKIVIIYLNNR